jgi:hypothetical protein
MLYHMYRETVLLGDGFVLEIFFLQEAKWRLTLRKGRKTVVGYSSGGAYELKSVEKLRYDFERDVEDAKRQG